MSLQINLLRKNELRYQGVFSSKAVIFGSAGAIGGVLLLMVLGVAIVKISLQARLSRARAEWAQLDPQAAAVRADQTALTANRNTLGAMEKWSQGGGIPMFYLLRAVQETVPEQMRMLQFHAGQEKISGTSSNQYVLRFNGQAQGELTAVEAKRRLNASAELKSFCGEIRLVSSQRTTGDTWLYALEGIRPAGGGKP